MHIGRSLPPAAAPIGAREVISGICGIFRGERELDRFQSELKEYFGVKYCFLVSSGKAAFTLILIALKELFPDRNEVLIPAFTCYSVPASISRAGLRIRLCDLNPESLDLDLAKLSAMLAEATRPQQTGRLLAVVPTHLFGIPSNVPGLRKLIQDPGVTVIEDAAQAMGETWEGGKLGTLGDIGFFSLGRGKAFSTVEGGIILTDRDDIAEVLSRRVGSLPRYGFWRLMGLISKALGLMLLTHPALFWFPRSMLFLRLGETFFEPHFPILRMSPFQAGLSASWRERLQKMRDARKANVRLWTEILRETGDLGLCLQHPQSLGLLRLPIRIRGADRRESLLKKSSDKGAGVAPVYPDSINRLPELSDMIPAQACPVAESCARELVTLPTHGYVTQDDVTVIRRLLRN